MKKILTIILLAALMLPLAGCFKNQTADIGAPTEAPTSVPTAEPTQVPTAEPTEVPTEAPTEVPTEEPTEEPTAEPTEAPTAEPDPTPTPAPTAVPTSCPAYTPAPTAVPPTSPNQSVFDDALFIGNSVLHGLYQFGVITHGDFLTVVGLNVNTIYTNTDENGTPLIDTITGKGYKKVIINFGINEVGWPSQSTFINRYSQLIDDVRERLPGVTVYIVAITPVTKHYSLGKGQENGITIEHIRATNERIRNMCVQKGARFIETPDSLLDSEGYLPSDASSDGVHMNLKYDRLWADHITLKVMGVI